MKKQIGDKVRVHWADDPKPYGRGRIVEIYRGHRGNKYVVSMENEEIEVVDENQIVG